MATNYAIIVHGGAGEWEPDKQAYALNGVHSAVEHALPILQSGGTALDAVTAAVVALEDNPIFNAGTGAALNIDGDAQLDATIMNGADLRAGGVAALTRTRNPILIARKVMEQTEHVLLSGEGALRFARAMGFADYDPITAERRKTYRDKLELIKRAHPAEVISLAALLKQYPQLIRELTKEAKGTVGAAACDDQGNVAAATSTGGLMLKLVGRIGDSPIPGAGNYANRHGAASATGKGELMMRFLTTKSVCDLISTGKSPDEAIAQVLSAMKTQFNDDDMGMIAINAAAQVSAAHYTRDMPHAFYMQKANDIVSRIRAVAL